jgi:hypothetical protein
MSVRVGWGPGQVLAGDVRYCVMGCDALELLAVLPPAKPDEEMRKIVRICTPGGVILDPFTGGGAHGVAAIREGYRFLGAELVSKYVERASLAIEAAA